MKIPKILSIFIGLALAIVALEPVHADVFDCPAGDVDCLIDAINTANTNGGEDTINLEAGTYTLTTVDNTSNGPNGLPSITSAISVKGVGAETTIIKRDAAGPKFRIFRVAPSGVLMLDGLTIRDGDVGSTHWGGGILNFGKMTVTNCTFLENKAERGGGIQNDKLFSAASSTATITNCTLSYNYASWGGAGISNYESSPTIANCTFRANNARRGGGIFNHNASDAIITNCAFSDNATTELGGGISNENSSPTIANCTFLRNRADAGGGLFNHGSSDAIITNCTFTGNVAPWGGAIGNENPSPIITNCILWQNEGTHYQEISSRFGANPIVSYCDIDQDGFAGSDGNIREDPLFVDADNGNVHLQPGSPCIDAGTEAAPELPDTDFEDDPRIFGSAPDMGADEFVPPCVEVEIDIKPSSYPNSINLKSRGKVPVAIITTDDFDAYNVDPVSCEFAGAYPVHWKMEDIDDDGDYDMLFHYRTQELDLNRNSTEASLEGETYDEIQIIGTDSVRILPKGKKKGEKKARSKSQLS